MWDYFFGVIFGHILDFTNMLRPIGRLYADALARILGVRLSPKGDENGFCRDCGLNDGLYASNAAELSGKTHENELRYSEMP